MHIVAKIFDIIKYLKNEKNKYLKKKKEKENRENGPKRPNFFFHAINPQNKTKKMSIAKLNSIQWLERYSLRHTC